MRFNSLINNVKASEWGLILPQAYIFSWVYELPSWADSIDVEGIRYYFASRHKVIEELPLLTNKQDTIYRYYKQLESLDLIVLKNIENKDYVRVTEKGKTWNKVGNESDCSEMNPTNSSEMNPTYNIYNNINNILMSKIKISDHVLEFTITDKGIETKIPTDEKTYKYFKIAEAFRLLFKNNLLGLGAPTVHVDNATFKNYVTPIRLLFEKEKIEKEVLHEVYEYLGSEDALFWKGNILSTKTLREKITKLIAQKEQVKNRKNRNNNNFSNNPGI